ncbi:hypothetical protein BS50DRAFT_372135 [Corynespora cassiicola Philippines]|uniref:Uncharacterized protein n=1 Tax=Corynespora cassiicola Philippines TaxID=1448308 RepID=A0A2T2NMW2_CORCC|nr:hypothetical protein BS50DRAFT_372135 [Corynespora cassiicola Philippines]
MVFCPPQGGRFRCHGWDIRDQFPLCALFLLISLILGRRKRTRSEGPQEAQAIYAAMASTPDVFLASATPRVRRCWTLLQASRSS